MVKITASVFKVGDTAAIECGPVQATTHDNDLFVTIGKQSIVIQIELLPYVIAVLKAGFEESQVRKGN